MINESAATVSRDVAPGDRGVEQTLGRSAALLDALAGAFKDGLRFTDLVAATHFSKATVHRLLAGLRHHGFIEVDAKSNRIFLGFRLAGWGGATRGRHGLVDRAAPILRTLAEQLGDTVYLILRDGTMTICVSRYEGSFPIRALPLTLGDRNALGVGSGSLALLAFLPDAEIDQALADPVNIAARERRGVTETEIRRQVALARKRGYAMSDGLTPGMIGIGLPVKAASLTSIVSVSVASIVTRMREPRRSEVLSRLAETVQAVGAVIGSNT